MIREHKRNLLLEEEEESSTLETKKSIWTGIITIGLVNVPVKLFSMTYDKGIKFHFLHNTDGQPLKYVKVCTKENKPVPWDQVARGFEVAKNEYIIIDRKELDAAKPESDNRIRITKFIDYSSVDPIYFEKTYALLPDNNKEAYALLLKALTIQNKAGVGQITLRTKEYPTLLHVYQGLLVLTTLRYSYDVVSPKELIGVHKFKEPSKKELDMAIKIINNFTGDFDISEFEDHYMQRIEKIIAQKKKGKKIHISKPPRVETKGLIISLRETLKQLKKK